MFSIGNTNPDSSTIGIRKKNDRRHHRLLLRRRDRRDEQAEAQRAQQVDQRHAEQQHHAAAQRHLKPEHGHRQHEHDVNQPDQGVRQQLADDQLRAAERRNVQLLERADLPFADDAHRRQVGRDDEQQQRDDRPGS